MLQREHSAILLTFIKQPFVIKIFILSIFEWPLKTGFTVHCYTVIPQSLVVTNVNHIICGHIDLTVVL